MEDMMDIVDMKNMMDKDMKDIRGKEDVTDTVYLFD